jgi:hypothetical protein
MFSATTALAALGFALTANAHLFISSPQPIAGTAPKDPLDASGSNFPCHGVSLPASGGEKMAAGSPQLLAFDTGNGANTAVHGGGSCQISITYETDAAKVKDPKNWFVIYSIESGCPTNSMLNLDGSYQGPDGTYTGSYDCTDPKTNGVDCVNQFNFTIPKGVKDGHAIMAWTWFNNVGNRELYMNCINTQLSGGDGSEMSEFPSMFVANMASVDQCPTTEGVNVKFPFPGKYVTTKLASGAAAHTASTYPIQVPTGVGCAQDGAPVGGGGPAPSYGGSAAPGSSSAPAASSPAASAQPSGSPSPSGGILTVTTIHTITGSSAPSSAAPSAPAGASSAMGSSVAPSAPAGASSAAPSYPPTSSGSPSTGGSCANGKVSCSSPGSVVCIGSSQFGICDVDNCAVPQALAAGTHCSGGVVAKRDHVRRHIAHHGVHRNAF